MKIGFQGVFGSFSSMVCKKYYPDFQPIAFETFEELFIAAENSTVEYIAIPLENSYAGRVSDVHYLLQKSSLFIVAEHFQKIEHNICGIHGAKIEDIREILSHPQALMQCRENLKSLLPLAKQTSYSNTAAAAKYIADNGDKNKSVICSKLAAETYDLEILRENIQDDNNNTTVFVVLSKNIPNIDYSESKKVITTLVFTIRNIPSALYKALGGFATNGINIIKLESYIMGGVSNQADFLLSFEGDVSNKSVSLALEELGFFSKRVKILGIYEADRERISFVG